MSCQLSPEWQAKRLQCVCSKFKTVEISHDPLRWIFFYPGRKLRTLFLCPLTKVFFLMS